MGKNGSGQRCISTDRTICQIVRDPKKNTNTYPTHHTGCTPVHDAGSQLHRKTDISHISISNGRVLSRTTMVLMALTL